MKNLWKILLQLTLVVTLAMGMAACGNDDDDDDDMDDPCDLCSEDQVCENEVCVDPSDPCDACTADQTCVEEVCVDNTDEDPPIEPADVLAGKTFAFLCILDGDVTQPPGLGPVLKGLINCDDIPPIGLTILTVEDGGETLTLVGASLTSDNEYDPVESIVLAMPPADFSTNPLMVLSVDGEIELEVEGITLRILDLEITGVVQQDLESVADGTFAGAIDPAPLEEVLGSPPCNLIPGICDAEGYINLFVEDLTAVAVDTTIPPVE